MFSGECVLMRRVIMSGVESVPSRLTRGQLRDIATGPLNTYSRAESGYHQTPTHGRAATVPKRRIEGD